MSLISHPRDDEDDSKHDPGYVIGRRRGRTLHPISPGLKAPAPMPVVRHPQPPAAEQQGPAPIEQPKPAAGKSANPAVELIRRKLDQLYTDEPDAKQEAKEARQESARARSKHQAFMYELSSSGKPLAQIQTEWHNYYVNLPEQEKHEVWQEFYANSTRQEQMMAVQPSAESGPAATTPPPEVAPSRDKPEVARDTKVAQEALAKQPAKTRGRRSVADVKKQLLKKVAARNKAQLKAKHHLQSLAFGIGTGALVLLVFLFGFFNEIIIAPFIQPSRHAGATPIILNTDGVATSDTPEVIIPKINVQIPIDFTQTSIDEAAVDASLDSGILHYPNTAVPGQQGNGAFFGHSSNNIFNKGKYKFAFVLLHELVPGDIFYITYNKQVYSYRVYEKRIVPPTEVSVLGNVAGKTATAALITCDPPGTAINRLVVWGEQVSPAPGSNAPAPTPTPTAVQPEQLASNGPTLWGRFTGWVSGLWSSD